MQESRITPGRRVTQCSASRKKDPLSVRSMPEMDYSMLWLTLVHDPSALAGTWVRNLRLRQTKI